MFGCSSFPMSLADRSFDSDGNCVCVFFFSHLFSAESRCWTVVLGNLQATK